MPVMLVLVPMLLLILPPLQTNTAQVQWRKVLGRGHAGQVWQEGEEDGDASNAGARANAAVDIAAATDQYSSGILLWEEGEAGVEKNWEEEVMHEVSRKVRKMVMLVVLMMIVFIVFVKNLFVVYWPINSGF